MSLCANYVAGHHRCSLGQQPKKSQQKIKKIQLAHAGMAGCSVINSDLSTTIIVEGKVRSCLVMVIFSLIIVFFYPPWGSESPARFTTDPSSLYVSCQDSIGPCPALLALQGLYKSHAQWKIQLDTLQNFFKIDKEKERQKRR